ncbi:MAG TPA: hypothetical protein DEA73_02745 [Peptococcaceae bacterium]|nr:hypothetical protein [Peptococcaceae bacterium]
MLCKTLRSTNPIETALDKAQVVSHKVKGWRNGQQVLRWLAAGFLQAEKGMRCIQGYRELPLLAEALKGTPQKNSRCTKMS